VAELVHRVAGIPTAWARWDGDVRVPPGTEILMNATTLGAAPLLAPVPVIWESLEAPPTAVDVITNPRITPFLEAARAHGCTVVDGVEMLVQLAMQLFEAWTGLAPAEEVFQQAVAAALDG
jgi:shikimate dehydrogenase